MLIRKPIGDIHLTDLDVFLHLVDTGRLGVILHFDDTGRLGVTLHFDDIWDLSILGYLENIGMAGSQMRELTATDTSLRGVKVCLALFSY